MYSTPTEEQQNTGNSSPRSKTQKLRKIKRNWERGDYNKYFLWKSREINGSYNGRAKEYMWDLPGRRKRKRKTC
jgi:hypothetical protein